ncbi:hypothetical protein PAPYR_12054 [Paratrimastix pyriformis]|uniref:Uncharacterized protein n=1 Tax=Paratrimastix pyriformis TaxID=342808 RepID=A0ABQ8U2I7_9EUKA|nr:hypothetical protein PAPYR_12054 [Paratrimastix pyriformis]
MHWSFSQLATAAPIAHPTLPAINENAGADLATPLHRRPDCPPTRGLSTPHIHGSASFLSSKGRPILYVRDAAVTPARAIRHLFLRSFRLSRPPFNPSLFLLLTPARQVPPPCVMRTVRRPLAPVVSTPDETVPPASAAQAESRKAKRHVPPWAPGEELPRPGDEDYDHKMMVHILRGLKGLEAQVEENRRRDTCRIREFGQAVERRMDQLDMRMARLGMSLDRIQDNLERGLRSLEAFAGPSEDEF